MKKKLITPNDDLIAQGLAKRLIRVSEDGKRVEYLNHGISRDWTKPEASVEAKAYLTLVLQYGYPDDRIRLFAPVTIGSSLREADIEVYADAKHETPIIIAECKKEEVSEAEFRQAVEQAFSYAVSEGARYVWTTSGIKNEYYADQIAAVAEKATAELRDKLDSEYKSAAEEAWPDEEIFMAIAEDIGFDATGKPTKVNELDEIGAELAKFIAKERGDE